MNTEEIMKLADAYAAAYMSFSESKARAALEAALSAKQEPYDKTEMNAFVQNLYDQKMREGKHGHYETMFHVVHQAIKRANPAPSVNAQDANNDEVICPKCVHQFRAIPMNVQERISELEAQNERLWVALKGYHSNSAKQDWPDDIWIAAEVALREAAIAAVESNASTHELNSANSLE